MNRFLKVRMRKVFCTKRKKYKESKKPKISYIWNKMLLFSSIEISVQVKLKKAKKEKSIETSKINGLVNNK